MFFFWGGGKGGVVYERKYSVCSSHVLCVVVCVVVFRYCPGVLGFAFRVWAFR